ncbi:MAG: CDP-glucose 4,6-dehydratase [Polyangiaceae bacterium]
MSVASPHPPSPEDLRTAYAGKKVLLTGHTGFKGGWLAVWLHELGADVVGYSLPAEKTSVFARLDLASTCEHIEADVRDVKTLRAVVARSKPDFVFHLAAQAIVRDSYDDPLGTIATNVTGTANVLDALRTEKIASNVVIVTSDKCYENREWDFGYRENESMGGHDVYSMSKGAAELITASYRRSFFDPAKAKDHGVYIASARAGNVIGGGDWANHRIIPDMIRAIESGKPLAVRNPASVRPWQHVLEPLGGYLLLGARLAGVGTKAPRASFCEGWNFGPQPDSTRPVRELADALVKGFAAPAWIDAHDPNAPHEASLLRLSIDKAFARLGWSPRWNFEETVTRTVDWYAAQRKNSDPAALRDLTRAQIAAYSAA